MNEEAMSEPTRADSQFLRAELQRSPEKRGEIAALIAFREARLTATSIERRENDAFITMIDEQTRREVSDIVSDCGECGGEHGIIFRKVQDCTLRLTATDVHELYATLDDHVEYAHAHGTGVDSVSQGVLELMDTLGDLSAELGNLQLGY